MFNWFLRGSAISAAANLAGGVPASADTLDPRDAKIAELTQEVARTGVAYTAALEGRDIALRQNAHLEAEVEKLERDVAGLLPDAEKYRAQKAKRTLNLRQFKSVGAEAQKVRA